MKISGAHSIPVMQERAYVLLRDPVILARCMPGCDALERIGEDEYEMKMKMVISSVQGLFAGKVRVADQTAPVSFRLIVEGNGKVGFMKGEGLLTLTEEDGGTQVQYDGEVQIGGMIAGVGQRLLDATAKLVIRKFFEKLIASIAGETQQAAVGPAAR
ncbi:MAG: SRPBCC family protein [Bryobacteraceae bacterium]